MWEEQEKVTSCPSLLMITVNMESLAFSIKTWKLPSWVLKVDSRTSENKAKQNQATLVLCQLNCEPQFKNRADLVLIFKITF